MGVTFPRGKVTKGRRGKIPFSPPGPLIETAKRGLRPPLWKTPGVAGEGYGLRGTGDIPLRAGTFPRPNKTKAQRSGFRFEEEDGLADMELGSLPHKRNVACPSDEAGWALLSRVGK